MSVSTHIKNLINSSSDSQLLSVRIPSTTVNLIDELASELDKTRSDLIITFIHGGVEELEKQLSETRARETPSEIESSERTNSDVRYFMLNTNYNNSEADHYTMLENEEASAFYSDWKEKIANLHENDVVFLYQSRNGICGYGFADKELIMRDHEGQKNECYSRKLNKFKRATKPITAKACRDATKSNLNFRMTMVSLTKEQGEALIAKLNS
ncbi:hypothetical protein [Methylovulum psychrotolerans]|uniref:EVE domain-containing protein n=1 Tax=Methylovulum psychrotolerans TaxID=1704499 RepID=A0A2S5CG54_9GAMM|nr:hypothetical protein [Methylovulum psychrotolerans]POZ49791.1 hypothetical protein AADEFJLK_04406 [Methylovulum psychrotolerans]